MTSRKKWTPNKIDMITRREAKKLGLVFGNNANVMSPTEWTDKVQKLTDILKKRYDLDAYEIPYGIRVWANQPIND